MPEYLAPGVFVEEVSYRAKSIEGVGTSVAGIAGPTRTGPLRGTPEVVTSYAEFERIFGDASDLRIGGKDQLNYTALAAQNFFGNGGKQLYVARIYNGTEADDTAKAASAATDPVIAFGARFPGKAGDLTLEVTWRDSENLLQTADVSVPADGTRYYLKASDVPKEAKVAGATLGNGKFPLSIEAVIEPNGDNYTIVGAVVSDKNGDDVDPAVELDGAVVAEHIPDDAVIQRVTAKKPINAKLADGVGARLSFSKETNLSAYHGAVHWGDNTELLGTLNADGDTLSIKAAFNDGVDSDITLPLAALNAVPPDAKAELTIQTFDLDAIRNDQVIFTAAGIGTESSGDNTLQARLPKKPDKRSEELSQPVYAELGSGNVYETLFGMFESKAIKEADPLTGKRYLIKLSGGGDGNTPSASAYAGQTSEVHGSTGLAALAEVEDISIVATPAAADTSNHQAIVLEVQKHCRKMRYRVGIVDSRKDMSISEVQAFRSQFSDDRLALYYPWVVSADPRGIANTIAQPPSGFMAGIYARTDVDRGVHKSPANVPVFGALRFNQNINRFQQELLNPMGINCLRSFPGRGHRVWGGRTLSGDPEWKYLNVRRYFLFLERSIEKGTQWAVFEPNGEALWANVRTTIDDFLFNEWKNGHLLGGDPKAAYFVRCDRSTMTQNDIDNGRLVCEIGVAPLRPAEFVIFRIGQKTADA